MKTLAKTHITTVQIHYNSIICMISYILKVEGVEFPLITLYMAGVHFLISSTHVVNSAYPPPHGVHRTSCNPIEFDLDISWCQWLSAEALLQTVVFKICPYNFMNNIWIKCKCNPILKARAAALLMKKHFLVDWKNFNEKKTVSQVKIEMCITKAACQLEE